LVLVTEEEDPFVPIDELRLLAALLLLPLPVV
jgi:hypothetical protein